MNNTVNERIESIANELYSGNVNLMCRNCGIRQSTMSNIVAGRMSKPSFEVLSELVSKTNVYADWLLTGEGAMLKADKSKESLSLA